MDFLSLLVFLVTNLHSPTRRASVTPVTVIALATLFLLFLLDTERSSPAATKGSLLTVLTEAGLDVVIPRWVATVLLLLSFGFVASSS